MKILILGGTRFLGRALVESARSRNHEVTLFNRGQLNSDPIEGVERLYGDRDGDLAPLRGRRWDAVIDTCGFVPRVVAKSAQLLREQADHYTFISSISAYADFSQPGITEEGPLETIEPAVVEEITRSTAGPIYGPYYGGLKALCEQAAEAAMPGRVSNVRAGLIVGPHDYTDRLTYWIGRVAQGGEVLAPGRPERRIQVIDVKDLADWCIRMAELKRPGIFNATGPDYSLTMGQLLEACRAVSGSDATFTWVAERFLQERGVAPWTEMPLWIPETFGLGPESEPSRGFLSINCDRAMAAGLTFRPLAETIRDLLAWERTRSTDEGRKAGLDQDRESALLQAWRAYA